MVSTPSRSSAATRISLPIMVGPTSARAGAAAGFGSIVVLLMVPFMAGYRGQRKTHDRFQPWGTVEIGSSATRPGGRFPCDDNQTSNLQRGQIHQHER